MGWSSAVSERPLVIGGMHRSGTSLTASLFAGAGIDLGTDLLQANHANPRGYFEDVGFYDYHRRALVALGVAGEGFTTNGPFSVPPPLHAQGRDLLAARMGSGTAWGWKDPRTTLFLDFWRERLPEARYVFVFRRPWEVADSLFRRGDEAFAMNPPFVLDVWTHYNRLIIDFVRRHPASCLIFEITQVVNALDLVFAAVRSRLGVPLDDPADLYCPELFTRDHSSTHPAIVRAVSPEAWRTYEELVDLAGSVSYTADASRPEQSPGECAVGEWARASRVTARAERELAVRARTDRERAERMSSRKPLAVLAKGLRHVSASVTQRLNTAMTAMAPRAPERQATSTPPVTLAFPRRAARSPASRAA